MQSIVCVCTFQPGSRSHFTVPSVSASGDALSLDDIQAAVNRLHDLWREAQGQMSDRDRYLSHLMQFQHLYHSALLTISQWLDRAEGRLFDAPTYGRNGDDVLRECADIQRDMDAVNAQLDTLNRLCAQLKEETSAENGRLIQEAVTQLGERVALLEKQVSEAFLCDVMVKCLWFYSCTGLFVYAVSLVSGSCPLIMK